MKRMVLPKKVFITVILIIVKKIPFAFDNDTLTLLLKYGKIIAEETAV